jgi:hypothetical protein
MSDTPTGRQDTKLESEGAEFLVMGLLLIEGIFCYKAYVNFPGYDLIAVNPLTQKTARIQVKSRWATDYDRGFPIKNFNCDFVVHVALNRGYRFSKRKTKVNGSGKRSPDFYVFPVEVVRAAQNIGDKWEKVMIRNIPEVERYKDNWDLIATFLGGVSA